MDKDNRVGEDESGRREVGTARESNGRKMGATVLEQQ